MEEMKASVGSRENGKKGYGDTVLYTTILRNFSLKRNREIRVVPGGVHEVKKRSVCLFVF